ncbi:hypothetical protein CcaverHIS002_0310560 [Cutaneotrichosporon cavernicola]|nr:hypothetical protein CcaverHIS002_0310560 [Cutaneotrichosporon cavernicola]
MPSPQSSQSSGLSSPPSSRIPSPGAALSASHHTAPSPPLAAPSPGRAPTPPAPSPPAPKLRFKVAKPMDDETITQTHLTDEEEKPRGRAVKKGKGKASEDAEEAGEMMETSKGKGKKNALEKAPVDGPKKNTRSDKRKRGVVEPAEDEEASKPDAKPDDTASPEQEPSQEPSQDEPKVDEPKMDKAPEESQKKKPKVMPKKRPAPAGTGTPTSSATAGLLRKPKPQPMATPAPFTSLLASTLSKLSTAARWGGWTDEFTLTAEQEQQHAASLVARTKAATDRARAAEYPLKMQAAKDAYRADHAINGQRRVINVQGAMGIQTLGLASRMVKAVLNGDVKNCGPKK